MRLYHFCAAHMVESILKNGLTLGKCPLVYPIGQKLLRNCQWLTSEGDPKKQTWATSHMINYSRTAYRLTIEIPALDVKRLHTALDFIKMYPVECRTVVEDWAGHEHWFIYKGIIPLGWIAECIPTI